MFKKLLAVIVVLLIVGGIAGWYFIIRATTSFTSDYKIVYIYTNEATPDAVLKTLEKDSVATQSKSINWLAARMGYWEKIKPGRYKIPQGESLYGIVRRLRNGIQEPVNFIISRKIRQKQDLARMIAKNFESDSTTVMAYLFNNDTLCTLGLDTTNWMTAIINDTYTMTWTWPVSRVFRKLQDGQKAFWEKDERKEKAKTLGYTQHQLYTLASIISEETNNEDDKLNIASTYLNRLKIGMKLQADPTIRFALKNFALNRVMQKDLLMPSPYNTYLNEGLPPGPICTVDGTSIDAVLNAPQTDYLYFVANADLRGGSTFSSNYSDHLKLAHEYQDSLTAFLKRKAEKKAADSISRQLR